MAFWSADEVTDGWCLVRIAIEGDKTQVGGVSLWDAEWTPTQRNTVAHPQHSAQRHLMYTYELVGTDAPVPFAAGEFSHGVWGVYVPADADGGAACEDQDTYVSELPRPGRSTWISAVGLLRYCPELAGTTGTTPDLVAAWPLQSQAELATLEPRVLAGSGAKAMRECVPLTGSLELATTLRPLIEKAAAKVVWHCPHAPHRETGGCPIPSEPRSPATSCTGRERDSARPHDGGHARDRLGAWARHLLAATRTG